MFCQQCGNQVPDSGKFCEKCGSPMAQPSLTPVPPPPSSADVQPQVQANKGKKGVMLWLLFLLGTVGFCVVSVVVVGLFMMRGPSKETAIANVLTTDQRLSDEAFQKIKVESEAVLNTKLDTVPGLKEHLDSADNPLTKSMADQYRLMIAGPEILQIYPRVLRQDYLVPAKSQSDLTHCPGDFVEAYYRHLSAWEDRIKAVEKLDTAAEQDAVKKIADTYSDVKAIAARYGVVK